MRGYVLGFPPVPARKSLLGIVLCLSWLFPDEWTRGRGQLIVFWLDGREKLLLALLSVVFVFCICCMDNGGLFTLTDLKKDTYPLFFMIIFFFMIGGRG